MARRRCRRRRGGGVGERDAAPAPAPARLAARPVVRKDPRRPEEREADEHLEDAGGGSRARRQPCQPRLRASPAPPHTRQEHPGGPPAPPAYAARSAWTGPASREAVKAARETTEWAASSAAAAESRTSSTVPQGWTVGWAVGGPPTSPPPSRCQWWVSAAGGAGAVRPNLATFVAAATAAAAPAARESATACRTQGSQTKRERLHFENAETL